MRKALVVVALVVGCLVPRPAQAYYGVEQTRQAFANAAGGPWFRALVSLTDTQAKQENYGGHGSVCVGVYSQQINVAVEGCADRPFTIGSHLDSARAVGTITVEVHRWWDYKMLGYTKAHYDLTWSKALLASAQAAPMLNACPSSPWRKQFADVSVAPTASVWRNSHVTGSITIDGYGTIPFTTKTATFNEIGEVTNAFVDHSVKTGVSAKPLCVDEGIGV